MAEAQLTLLQQLDAQLENFFAGWNGLSTLLAVVLIATIFAPLFLGSEPDIHPFLLGRQSFPTPVRQPGESAIYRNANVPHGYPLQSGLNIREEGAPVYAAGRDGDLRDIWKKISKDGNGNQKLMSIRGRDIVEKQSPKDLTKELVAVGGFLQSRGSQKVLVMLHNSTELLSTIFAGAFYGFEPILVSPARYNEAILAGIVKHTDADALIAPAGLLSPAAISQNKKLKSVIWVVEPSSRHIDFTDADDKSGNTIQWHDLSDKATTSELPKEGSASQKIVFLQSKTSSGDAFEGDFVEFTSESIIAAVAAQIAALPREHVLGEKDLVLPLDALTDLYPLVISLAGLWAGSSLALLSAAGGSKVDFDLAFATKGLTPTIIVASSAIMARARSNKMGDAKGLFASVQKNSHTRSLAAGAMKVGSASSQPQLRMIYVSETPTAASDSVPLSGIELNDLRYLTRSRIIYSLVVPRVAGAVAQTNPLDYRLDDSVSTRNHFGPPMKSVEVKLVDTSTSKISDENLKGELVACGPAVVGKEAKTGVMGRMRDDGTLALV